MAHASARDETAGGGLWHRPSFLASAIVVALLLAIGGVVVISNLVGGRDTTTAPPPVSVPPATASASTGGAPSVCGLGGVETSGTVPRPPDARWTLVGTTAAPSVNGSGPGVSQTNGLRYCFAHTPTGAVVAAANFVALGSTPAIFNDVVDHSVATGPGKAALKDQGPASDGGVRIQVVGFRLLTYDAGRTATVDIALRTSRGALAGQVYDLIWQAGDWRMRVTEQGELLTQLVQLPDLTGYIPWSGA